MGEHSEGDAFSPNMQLSVLNVHEIYQQTLLRALKPAEIAHLDELIAQYPYFSLPRWLKIQQLEDPQETFKAALRVGKRQQLKKYLHDRLYFAEISLRATMADQADQAARNIWFPPFPYGNFSILNTDKVPVRMPDIQESFQIPYPSNSLSLPFLSHILEEQVLKYLPLIAQIRTEIRLPDSPFKETRVDKGTNADQLVDRFLSNLPSISPARPDEEVSSTEVINKAKASVTANEEFVSETLARLHVRQGNKEEGIRMYKLLGLRFPEKSDYFARQIQLIQKEAEDK